MQINPPTTNGRPVSPIEQSPDERSFLAALRPASLDQFSGQDHIKARLALALRAAQIQHRTIDHTLLFGPPGLGKTTLAGITARELSGNLVTTSGPALRHGKDLVGILTSLEENDVLFIDEIHRLPRQVEELLYTAMEDFRYDFIIGTGRDARAYPVALNHFTLIGATTRKGMLSEPLRHRFGLDFGLEFYDLDTLAKIIARSADMLSLTIETDAAAAIARRSRGTPRIANRLLRRVRDYAIVCEQSHVTVEIVDESMRIEGVDSLGCDELDRRYLCKLVSLNGGNPVGLSALAAALQEDADTLEDVVEPFLSRQDFIVRTSSGRRLTKSGLDFALKLGAKP